MRHLGFWLRWSGRDLRQRWVQVGAIALIIALGSGFYSGLTSTSAWRRTSYDASYARTNLFDLRLTLSTGSYLPADQLRSVVSAIPDADQVTGSSVRLTGPTQVDASTGDRTIIAPGTVIGSDAAADPAAVSAVSVVSGRGLTSADDGRPVVLLDPHFAQFYDLAPSGTLTLSGGRQVDYVGTGMTPEYFVVMDATGHQASAADYAVLVTVAGHRPGPARSPGPGQRPGADPGAGGRRRRHPGPGRPGPRRGGAHHRGELDHPRRRSGPPPAVPGRGEHPPALRHLRRRCCWPAPPSARST